MDLHGPLSLMQSLALYPMNV